MRHIFFRSCVEHHDDGSKNSGILALPSELIYHVASYLSCDSSASLSNRSLQYHHRRSDLSSFRAVCSTFRSATTLLRFREIHIFSLRQLSLASKYELEILRLTSDLHIHLDLKFFRLWEKAFSDSSWDISSIYPNKLPLASKLFSLLVTRTTQLRSLSITLSPSEADSSSEIKRDDTEWGQSPKISFGKGFVQELNKLGSSARDICWHSLECLTLEGVTDVGPLLERCPALKDLRLSTWEGYPHQDWLKFIKDMHCVPNLESLAISPLMDDAGTTHDPTDNSNDAEQRPSFSWKILEKVAKSLPMLRTLDLRTVGYSHTRKRMALRRIYNAFDPHSSLAAALDHLPELVHLTLPFDWYTFPGLWPDSFLLEYENEFEFGQSRAWLLFERGPSLESIEWLRGDGIHEPYIASFTLDPSVSSMSARNLLYSVDLGGLSDYSEPLTGLQAAGLSRFHRAIMAVKNELQAIGRAVLPTRAVRIRAAVGFVCNLYSLWSLYSWHKRGAIGMITFVAGELLCLCILFLNLVTVYSYGGFRAYFWELS